MPNDILSRMYDCGVIPVVAIDDASDALPLARTLLKAGIDAMEITFRTPAAADAIRAIAGEVPEMLIGAGTILTPEQAEQAKQADAAFAVSPGFNPRVVRAAADNNLPFMPGIATPSDIEAALELDCKVLKFFPAEPSGGLKYLKSIAAPFNHLGLKYIPLGGITTANVREYLSEQIVLACGGTWIAKRQLIADKDFDTIAEIATQAKQAVAQTRENKPFE